MNNPEAYPLFIGPKNCEAMTGLTWRFVKLTAQRLGVPVLSVTERKNVIPAAALLAAIEKENAAAEAARPPMTEAEEREAARRELARRLYDHPEEGSPEELAKMRRELIAVTPGPIKKKER